MPAVVMSSNPHDTETDVYPRWMGWVPIVAGVTSIGTGMVQSLIGAPTVASRTMTVIGPSVITAWLLVIGFLHLKPTRRQLKGVT